MNPYDRRHKILEVLCLRRHTTCDKLAQEFSVSKMTIRRDIEALMCAYPIETVSGRYGGGIKVLDGFYLNRAEKRLSPKQIDLLERLETNLEGDDLNTLKSILVQFAS